MTSQPIDMARAANDFEYYASHLLYIRTKAREYRLFNRWFPSQVRIWNSIKQDLQTNKPVRKIILKPRQAGASTLSEALLWWQVHTVPQTHALVLSMDKDSAQYIFDMARNFYESLPLQHRPMKRYSSKKEIVLENPDEKTRPTNPGLRSRIEVQTAGKYVPPRGANFNLVHFSEVAFWPNAEDIVPAIIPMVPYLPGTMIIYESTANGVDNFFKEEWDAAMRGDSAFDPIFFPWTIMPEYSLPFYSTEERLDFQADLDEEEQELLKLHHISLEQLKWRQFKITEMQGDVDKFHQEYPITDEEAFLFSGIPIFDRKVLQRVKTLEPVWTGDIDLYTEQLLADENGLLDIYEHPVEKGDYVIGVDVASGSGEDYSCMCVLKRTWPNGLCDQVAEWHGKVDPVALGRLAIVLAKYYKDAMLSIEINNHGLTTQTEAQRQYWNFYRWQYFDRVGRTYTQKLGWDCVDPGSLILTHDLRWVRADSLEVGDKLLGCEENGSGKKLSRRLNFQIVEAIKSFDAPKHLVTLENGTTTVVSNNHKFFTYRQSLGMFRWLRADELKAGDVVKYIQPWKPLKTYEAGRLSGLLDGEGYLSKNGSPSGLAMMIAQSEGIIADEAPALWRACGFDPKLKYVRHASEDRAHHKTMVYSGSTEKLSIISLLGSVRPKRLLQIFTDTDIINQCTIQCFDNVKVISSELIGAGSVLGIETSGHTLIVDGLCSHNTNISTKPILVDRVKACLRDGLVGIASEGLLQELRRYVKVVGTMTFEAESGHDDRVMAFLIGVTTLYIEDHNANFVVGAGQAIAAPTSRGPTMKYETEIQLPPIWDASDPRGTSKPREVDWRLL